MKSKTSTVTASATAPTQTASATATRPPTTAQTVQTTTAPAVSAPAAPIRADPEVGADGRSVLKKLPAEYYFKRPFNRPAVIITALAAFLMNMAKKPFVGDDQVMDLSMARAPKASVSKAYPSSKREPRRCWITLPRPWLKTGNFLKQRFGPGNIRYRNVTYASICHHPTSHWDAHPLCWQCYKDLDLPLCGLDLTIDCEHCDKMGKEAHNSRNERLLNGKPRVYSVKTGLPHNV